MNSNFNPDKQHTLKSAVSISGTGLHTGILADVTLKPANAGFGYQFQRVDLPNKPVIKADCDLVTDTSRGTTLEANGAKISTVEHLLAALVGMGVDNCLIEINGPEVPIMDGSSMPFIEVIEEVGIEEQSAAKIWYSIDENLYLTDEKKRVEMVIMPAREYQITTLIDFNSPVLGTQHAELRTMRNFKEKISSCRTFCFLHELEMLLEHNLIKGGDVNNAIVVVDTPVDQIELDRLKKIFNKDNSEKIYLVHTKRNGRIIFLLKFDDDGKSKLPAFSHCLPTNNSWLCKKIIVGESGYFSIFDRDYFPRIITSFKIF